MDALNFSGTYPLTRLAVDDASLAGAQTLYGYSTLKPTSLKESAYPAVALSLVVENPSSDAVEAGEPVFSVYAFIYTPEYTRAHTRTRTRTRTRTHIRHQSACSTFSLDPLPARPSRSLGRAGFGALQHRCSRRAR